MNGPSPQHRAECDCKEFYGGKCIWPECKSSAVRDDDPAFVKYWLRLGVSRYFIERTAARIYNEAFKGIQMLIHDHKLPALIEHAKIEASEGTCHRLQVGAVIVRDGRIISSGRNGAASGQPHCKIEECFPDGPACRRAVHAEANAIAFAARHGVATEGCAIVSTDSPCLDCARLIINAGIKAVYYSREYRDVKPLEELKRAGIYTQIV